MATDVTVPTLGESITEATLGQWLKKPGDPVKADEPVASDEPMAHEPATADEPPAADEPAPGDETADEAKSDAKPAEGFEPGPNGRRDKDVPRPVPSGDPLASRRDQAP